MIAVAALAVGVLFGWILHGRLVHAREYQLHEQLVATESALHALLDHHDHCEGPDVGAVDNHEWSGS